jgi:hypothetical protein
MGAIRMEITTIGLDLAKGVFRVHGVDATGYPPVASASADAAILCQVATLPSRHGSVRHVTSLRARAWLCTGVFVMLLHLLIRGVGVGNGGRYEL